ncbi:MAG: UMP kinase [Parcubacteria group bacterium 21-54-25]|nr:MAG: UMP kinase [Parcubacteria group bacterium 21-54-25]HQU07477.1 UMP kinase [Candidatus Paceibacterota bacterium]
MSTSKRVVVSVGGSLIVPDGIAVGFLVALRACVLRGIEQGLSFFIIAGGGKTARRYQEAAREVHGDLPRNDLDWLGIHATRLNAHLLRTIFREQSYSRIMKDPTVRIEATEPIIIGAGTEPGWSTDYCAVTAAKTLGAKRLVNLSNIDYVYEHDPKINPDAQPIERMTWNRFRSLIPTTWDPGLSAPFDPIAAKEAEMLGLEVAVINGAHLDRFEHYLAGTPFIGTTIS